MASKKRRSQRGAAIVEAAIVIPMMLVFLGTTMFAYHSYERKLEIQTTSRSAVLSYASHACEGGTIKKQPEPVDVPGTNASEVDAASNKLRASEQTAVNRSLAMARSETSTLVAVGATTNGKRVPLTRTVTSRSAVACNEKRYDNEWTALIEFAVDFARSGGGFVPGF